MFLFLFLSGRPCYPAAVCQNGNLPWAAYRALMAGRLIALDKIQESVTLPSQKYCDDQLLHVYSVWLREPCGIDQHCGGLQAGYCNCTSHISMHPRITHPQEPNEPTSPSGTCSTTRRTTNISQNWTIVGIEQFWELKKPEININICIEKKSNKYVLWVK